METNIRKWGNSAGAIIPATALAKSGLKVGDLVDVDVRAGEIVFKPAAPKFTLEGLLEASPKGAFELDQESAEWLRDSPVGREQDQ